VTVALANGTNISGGFEHERLRASRGSGLERVIQYWMPETVTVVPPIHVSAVLPEHAAAAI
jgi:hypothetical protein